MIVKHELSEVEGICPVREHDTVARQQRSKSCGIEVVYLFSSGPCRTKSATRALIFVGMESRGNSWSSSADGGEESKLIGLWGESRY